MESFLAKLDHEALVEIVRVAQEKRLKGAEGRWEDFVNAHDEKLDSNSTSDLARRTSVFLVDFLKTLKKKNLKLFSKIVMRLADRKAVRQLYKDYPNKEAPAQRLVRLTMEHPNYLQHYSFPSNDEEWLIIPLGELEPGWRFMKNMVSFDCEMVLCEDGTEAVVKVCAVDITLKVKLDKLVNPNKAVSDYRTEITGVSAVDLEGVTYSLIDVQNDLQKLLSDGTVIAGHNLHNDLRALKIDYARVIDMSYIYKITNVAADYSPSLNELCKGLLGSEVQKEGEPHNCINYAEAKMKLVLAKLEHGLDDLVSIDGKFERQSLLNEMDKLLTETDREILVEIVRVTQKKLLKGSKGGWKDFLKLHDKKIANSSSDPAKRTTDDLVAFLKTFSLEDYRKFSSEILELHNDRKTIKTFSKDFPENETPQQRLVLLTMDHPNYSRDYSFPSHDKGWVIVPLGNLSKTMKSKRMVSIDCEMVLCEDGTEAVVKICAVDSKLKVKLDKFVNPNKAISDYRTTITNVSAEDLEGVTYSLTDAQNDLKKILYHSVLVGHSLHNDLRALKFAFPRVIDSSYIFRIADLPATYSPSLKNLCKAVLGFEVRQEGEPHNCMNDAVATMKLVLAKVEHGFDDPISIEGKVVCNSELTKLLLHKVPSGTPLEELSRIFPFCRDVQIQADKKDRGQTYSTYAVFKNAYEADEAFIGIQGLQCTDTGGKLQKRAQLRLISGQLISFYVRRMTSGPLTEHDDLSKKRSAPELQNETEDPKRQRLCLQQCDHERQIELLELELRLRKDEISNLNKILAAVTRKQGL